jgi:GNAT superfamily N-acetyltransferase
MNDAQFSLRRLTADDADAVSALARVVWQATYPPLISQAQIDAMLADRYAPGRIRSELNAPLQAWWGARRNQTLVGFAHAMLDGTDCKLDKLYVHLNNQRQGIGGALVQAIEGWARQQRAHRLWLQVNRGNTQAIAAYRKYGFRIAESRVFDIGHGFVMDDYVMEQVL